MQLCPVRTYRHNSLHEFFDSEFNHVFINFFAHFTLDVGVDQVTFVVCLGLFELLGLFMVELLAEFKLFGVEVRFLVLFVEVLDRVNTKIIVPGHLPKQVFTNKLGYP